MRNGKKRRKERQATVSPKKRGRRLRGMQIFFLHFSPVLFFFLQIPTPKKKETFLFSGQTRGFPKEERGMPGHASPFFSFPYAGMEMLGKLKSPPLFSSLAGLDRPLSPSYKNFSRTHFTFPYELPCSKHFSRPFKKGRGRKGYRDNG